MATEPQGGASFNPDDASGLVDSLRAKITNVVVDFFTANSGAKFVNADFTYEGGGQKLTEHYMIGPADQWAPNASKTGVTPLKEGGRLWNKSDIFALVKSLVDGGFPKAQVRDDLSVFVGSDVQLQRVTVDGATYKDKNGAERQRTRMLVTKVYEAGKGAPATKGTAPKAGAKAAAAATAAPVNASDDANDAVLTEMIAEIVAQNPDGIAKDKLQQPIFIQSTKRKLASVRAALQARAQGKKQFLLVPLLRVGYAELVRFGDPGDPTVPAPLSYDPERVIADLSPVIPKPAPH